MLGGSEGQGGRREGGASDVTTASARRACQTGALSPHVRLSDLCDHLTGLLQRLDTGSRGGKLVFNIDLFLHTFQGMLVTLS